MALADWEIGASSTSTTISLNTVTPLVGTSSLSIAGGIGAISYGNMLPSKASLRPHAFTKGVLRTLIKPLAFGSTSKIGLIALQSDRNAAVTNAYFAAAESSAINLRKMSSFQGITGTMPILGTAAIPMVVGQIFALEFQWEALINETNGVDLVVRYGTATDFSNLADIIHYVDTSAPYTTSRGEGICWVSISQTQTYLLDQTSLYRIL